MVESIYGSACPTVNDIAVKFGIDPDRTAPDIPASPPLPRTNNPAHALDRLRSQATTAAGTIRPLIAIVRTGEGTLVVPTRSPNLITRQAASLYGSAGLVAIIMPPPGMNAENLIGAVARATGAKLLKGVPVNVDPQPILRMATCILTKHKARLLVDQCVRRLRRLYRALWPQTTPFTGVVK